ncbi:MAG: outer membrane beta-barrel protein [Candidatus Kapabacteria bacterium]|nr:outer membrane beta-barrel protein [Candidatus Kapabacteria bacterium]
MKRLATIAALCVLACTVSFAQGESMVRRTGGSTAMLFSLTGLSTLGAGNFMGGVGINHFLSDDMALRAGLGFTSSSTTKKANESAKEEVSSSTGFNISPGIRFNLAHNNNIAMYLGGQVMFGMGSGSSKFDGTETSTSSTTQLGVGAFAGAEWFPWSNVALGLEYGLGFSSTSGKTTTGGVETKDPSTTKIDLGLSTFQFLLSFYFN